MEHLIVYGSHHKLVDPGRLGACSERELIPARLAELKACGAVAGYAVVSTCNRFEVYVELASGAASELPRLALPSFELRGLDVVRHLIRVAGSLESMVLGENQILGQVREAWKRSVQDGHASKNLGAAFREALRGAREIRRRTGLGNEPVSVASVAARSLAERASAGSRIAIVGAGSMATKANVQLRKTQRGPIQIVNRTIERASALRRDGDPEALPLSEFLSSPPAIDAVFVGVSTQTAIIDRRWVEGAQRARGSDAGELILVDVGSPSGIAADVATMPGVWVLDLDGLQHITSKNAEARAHAAEQARPIVDQRVEAFIERVRRSRIDLASVHRAHVALAEERIERALGKIALPKDELEHLKREMLGLANAHAHLHLSDLKQPLAHA